MKRFLLVLALGWFPAHTQAQTVDDLYRYVSTSTLGSARLTALGQAGGALKGDLSSIQINPAAAALFDYGAFSLSTALTHANNRSKTGEFGDNASKLSLNLNQASGLLVFVSDKSPWNKVTLGFSYDQTALYNQKTRAGGIAEQGIDQYYLGFAEGNNYIDLLPFDNEFIDDAYRRIGADYGYAAQQGFLGVYSGLIAHDELGYYSRVDYTNVLQLYRNNVKGAIGRFVIHSAASYKDHLLFGASLGIHDLNYERFSYLNDDGYLGNNSTATQSRLDNYLFTSGLGVSLQLGMLIKLSKALVFGASYTSPTWYTMNDQTAQSAGSDATLEDLSFINLSLLNYYDDYRMKLPSSLSFNLAISPADHFNIVADYRRENFGDAQFLPNANAAFSAENQAMKSTYSTVERLSLGTEFQKGNRIMRFGYMTQSVPVIGGSLGARTAISTGIGYKQNSSQLDIGLRHEVSEENVFFFDALLPNAAIVKRSNLRLVATYTFSL